jgi:hypothetical protein
MTSPVKSPATPRPAEAPAEVTYLAVVNGSDLWVTAQVPDASTVQLALVHRHRKEVRLLPRPSMADMAGQDLPAGTLAAACPSADVLTDQDAGIWDFAVVGSAADPRRLRLAAQAVVYPVDPIRPTARPDGVVLTPYRTKDGRPAVNVGLAAPSVEVTELVSEPGRLAMTLQLSRWSGPHPTSLVLEQRRGPGRLVVPLEMTGSRASMTVPLQLLALQCRDAPASVWDVAVEGPAGRTRCGRTGHDVSDPRRVYRYATQSYHSASEGSALVFRPYFTNDRHLAVEIDGTEQVPHSA